MVLSYFWIWKLSRSYFHLMKYALFLILFLILKSVNAQTGCVSINGHLYTLNSGTTFMTRPQYNWNGTVTDINRVSNAATVLCLRPLPFPNSCYIRFPRTANPNCTNSAGSDATYCYDAGTLNSYSALPCSLDSDVFLLFVITMACAYPLIRNRKGCNLFYVLN